MEKEIKIVLLEKWILSLKGERKRESTLRGYAKDVLQLYKHSLEINPKCETELDLIKTITPAEGKFYFSELHLHNKPSTINTKLSTLKNYYNWLVELKEIQSNPFESIKFLKAFIVKEETRQKDIINLEDFHKVIASTRIRQKGERNFYFMSTRTRLLLNLLVGNGCRIEEALNIHLKDIKSLKNNNGYYIELKSNKVKNHIDKKLFIVGPILEAYNEYIKERMKLVADDKEDFLFCSNNNKKIDEKDNNRQLKKLMERNEIRNQEGEIVNFTNHCCRHLCATVLIKKLGYTKDQVSRLLGWKNNDIVDRYCHDINGGDDILIEMVTNVLTA